MRVFVRVKELAEQKGMSAEDVAIRSGIAIQTIHRLMETGNADTLTVGMVAQIAVALGVPTSRLIVDVK